MGELSLEAVWTRYQRAKDRRRCWESLWRDCYTYALPQRGAGLSAEFALGRNPADRLFDGTALDAVEQLAASMLAELTPPWPQWFGFIPGREVDPLERGLVAEVLDGTTQTVQAHFDRSNFAVEMHQALLDLVTVGSATLLFEEAPVGGLSAFRLTAIPMAEMAFEAGSDGQIEEHFRRSVLPLDLLQTRFPGADIPETVIARCSHHNSSSLPVVEAVLPDEGGFAYVAMLVQSEDQPDGSGHRTVRDVTVHQLSLAEGRSRGLWPLTGNDRVADIKTVNKRSNWF